MIDKTGPDVDRYYGDSKPINGLQTGDIVKSHQSNAIGALQLEHDRVSAFLRDDALPFGHPDRKRAQKVHRALTDVLYHDAPIEGLQAKLQEIEAQQSAETNHEG